MAANEGNANANDETRSLYQNLVDRVTGAVTRLQDARREFWHTFTTRVTADAMAVKDAAYSGSAWGFSVVKRLAVLYSVLLVLLIVLVATVVACLWLAAASSFLIRYYTLSRVPGNHVLPLSFNTMPLHTDWWRTRPIDEAMMNLIPSIEQARARGPRHLSYLDGDYYDNGDAGGGQSPLHGIKTQTADGPTRESTDDLLSRIRRAGLRLTNAAADDAHDGRGRLVQTLGGKFLDFKFSFLQAYANSILATSTMLLSTGGAKTLFLPGGAVNMEAIFDFGAPMFSAAGVYSARMQLVFLRESVGRDISVVVESAMLFAEDARSPQTLHSLDVLFRHSHSLSVRTGDLPPSLLVGLFSTVARLLFYAPVRVAELLQQWIQDSRSAPFPPIDHNKEVAVSLDLYERFVPPISLQRRLRAMNFTVHYHPQREDGALPSGSLSRRPTLTRMTFYSHVQLRGFSYFLSTYPLLSFLLMTGAVFAVYVTVALASMMVGGAVLYLRLFSGGAQGEQGAKEKGIEEFRWTFDHNASFSSSGASPTTPALSSLAPSFPRHGREEQRGGRRVASLSPDGSYSTRPTRSSSSHLRLAPPPDNLPPQSPATQSKKLS